MFGKPTRENRPAHPLTCLVVGLLNGKYIGKISEIESMLIDQYVSAEAITGIRTVRLIINHDCVDVASGINENDYEEIVNLIKDFLLIPNNKIKERIY